MTCPNPANNRACVSLYNGECLSARRCTPKPTMGAKVKGERCRAR